MVNNILSQAILYIEMIKIVPRIKWLGFQIEAGNNDYNNNP